MFSDYKFLKMRDGIELSVNIKETGSPVWIIVTHGIGEHMERHKYMTDLFGQDFNVFRYDLRGHGRSTGRRAYVEDFSLYMEDLREIVRFLNQKYRMGRNHTYRERMTRFTECDGRYRGAERLLRCSPQNKQFGRSFRKC